MLSSISKVLPSPGTLFLGKRKANILKLYGNFSGPILADQAQEIQNSVTVGLGCSDEYGTVGSKGIVSPI